MASPCHVARYRHSCSRGNSPLRAALNPPPVAGRTRMPSADAAAEWLSRWHRRNVRSIRRVGGGRDGRFWHLCPTKSAAAPSARGFSRYRPVLSSTRAHSTGYERELVVGADPRFAEEPKLKYQTDNAAAKRSRKGQLQGLPEARPALHHPGHPVRRAELDDW